MPNVVQGAELVNQMAQAALGETEVLNEDWRNINDIGSKTLATAENVEAATKTLVDRIGRTIFANDREYEIDGPDLIVDNRTFASITQKIRMRLPEATDNQTWMLNDGQVYEQDQYHAPSLVQTFFNNKITFEISKPSLPIRQFKSAFLNQGAWDAFEAMYRKAWTDSEQYFTERLTKSLVSTRAARNVAATYPATDYTAAGGPQCVNLRALYNTQFSANLTQAQCWTSADFMRFAFFQIERYARLMRSRKVIFNGEGENTFTPAAYLRAVFLSDFVSAANYYLYNGLNQYLTDRIGLPNYYTISAWQGNGTEADTTSASTIDKTFKLADGTPKTIDITGVIGMLYDRDALMITPYELTGYTHFNKAAEFINPFFKREIGYVDALDENAIVFTIS